MTAAARRLILRAMSPLTCGALATCLAAATLAGCSLDRFVVNRMEGSIAAMARSMNREASVRHAREASPALLSMLDGLLEISPENEGLLLRAAEMNATFAFALAEEEDPAWARALYRKARDYALRALRQEDEELAEILDKGEESSVRAALKALEPGDGRIPHVFWVSFGTGGLANLSRDEPRALAALPGVLAAMQRLTAIAPEFYYAGPHLFLAVYYSSRGSALGGNVAESARHFAEAFSLTEKEGYLLPHVLYARYHCVALGEKDAKRARAAFERELKYVLEAPADRFPDLRLANAVAKERAARLLSQIDDFILPPLEEEGKP